MYNLKNMRKYLISAKNAFREGRKADYQMYYGSYKTELYKFIYKQNGILREYFRANNLLYGENEGKIKYIQQNFKLNKWHATRIFENLNLSMVS